MIRFALEQQKNATVHGSDQESARAPTKTGGGTCANPLPTDESTDRRKMYLQTYVSRFSLQEEFLEGELGYAVAAVRAKRRLLHIRLILTMEPVSGSQRPWSNDDKAPKIVC